jgi:tRNA pseudouridine38-40 synthase
VGTLKDVGAGKMSPDEFLRVLLAADRTLAGATAPARGLFLHRVVY